MDDAGLLTIESAFPVAETVDRLAAAAEAAGMRVFARVDHAAGAAEAGMALRPTELLLVGNPRGGTPLMQDNQTAGHRPAVAGAGVGGRRRPRVGDHERRGLAGRPARSRRGERGGGRGRLCRPRAHRGGGHHGLTPLRDPHNPPLHYSRMARVQISVGNELANELGNDRDAMLKALIERVGVNAYLRGNELTLDGDDGDAVEQARSVVEELAQLVAEGVSVGAQTVDAVAGVLTADGRAVDVLHDVVWMHRGNKVTPKTIVQKRYVDAIRANTVTFGIGPAGTGKTYLAIALAVAALQEREVARIILTRPAVEAGERLGFLPGDLLAKVDPYLRPLFDALHDMLDAERLASYMDKGMVEVAPLAFMRGRTLNDSFIILDEAQNTSPEQMQMFLTRLGFGSKVVVTGDITQIDLPRDQRSGLVNVMSILDGVPDIAFVRFSDADVVRHKLVQRIVSAYREHSERARE